MYWILGIGVLATLALKVSLARQMTIYRTITNLSAKIRRLRVLAQKGDQKALQNLKNLDKVLAPLETQQDRDSAKILASLRYDNLYPPSAL